MNRKLILGSLGFLGFIGLGSLGNFYEKKVIVPEVEESDSEDGIDQIKRKFNITDDGLVYITRVLYFEGTFDDEINNENDLRLSYSAIASVIKNREAFDRLNKTDRFTKEGLVGVVNKYVLKRGKKVYQFSCIPDNSEYFQSYETLVIKNMDREKAEVAQNVLVDVLTGKIKDPTDGALYYKTKGISFGGSRPVRWHGKKAFNLNEESCEMDHSVDVLSHKYYGIKGCNYTKYVD